jgi:hypothetical protein
MVPYLVQRLVHTLVHTYMSSVLYFYSPFFVTLQLLLSVLSSHQRTRPMLLSIPFFFVSLCFFVISSSEVI